MPKRGKLVIITAPSGTGKSTLIRRFLEKHPDVIHSKSCTTRKVRDDKRDAGDYIFIDRSTFKRWISEGKLVEWAEYCGNLYGTPKEPLDRWLEEGKYILLDLEIIGGTKLKKFYGDDTITIFLLPPNDEELKRRLDARGTDSADARKARLERAIHEMEHSGEYDYSVINDDLDRACDEIESIVFSKC